ncbi:hypothetical protein KM043_017104 [Ampulex compressa]|nr:hypothetical protein KM043_017104 [Ampulex compressa]
MSAKLSETGQNTKPAENYLFYGKIGSCAADSGVHDMVQAAYVNRDQAWCPDSSCSSHLCKNPGDFSDVWGTESEKLHQANNASTDVKARENVNVVIDQGRGVKNVKLSNALFVRDLRTNLLSVDVRMDYITLKLNTKVNMRQTRCLNRRLKKIEDDDSTRFNEEDLVDLGSFELDEEVVRENNIMSSKQKSYKKKSF